LTFEMILAFAILAGALVIFLLDVIAIDFVAFCIMALILALGPILGVAPHEAVSGFSNPATITILAMFVLSAGIYRKPPALYTKSGAGRCLTHVDTEGRRWLVFFREEFPQSPAWKERRALLGTAVREGHLPSDLLRVFTEAFSDPQMALSGCLSFLAGKPSAPDSVRDLLLHAKDGKVPASVFSGTSIS